MSREQIFGYTDSDRCELGLSVLVNDNLVVHALDHRDQESCWVELDRAAAMDMYDALREWLWPSPKAEPDTELEDKEAAEEQSEREDALRQEVIRLGDIVQMMNKDLFRQQSAIHTSRTMQHTATHEALVGLLSEIRDRLPVPATSEPASCPGLFAAGVCAGTVGHAGPCSADADDIWSERGRAPELCNAVFDPDHPHDNSALCTSRLGHAGAHGNMRLGLSWPRYS